MANEKTYIGELVKSAEEFVEQPDKILGRALRGQGRKAHYVRKQNAETKWFIYIQIKSIAYNGKYGCFHNYDRLGILWLNAKYLR